MDAGQGTLAVVYEASHWPQEVVVDTLITATYLII